MTIKQNKKIRRSKKENWNTGREEGRKELRKEGSPGLTPIF